MISDYFRLAVNNLRHRKRRSWLTVIGTLIGILAVVSLVSIGQGLGNAVSGQLEDLGGDKLIVSPGGGINAQFSSTTFELTEDDLDTVKITRGVKSASGRVSGSFQAKFGRESQGISVIGTEPDSKFVKDAFGIEITQGRYIRSTDNSNIIVSKDAAENTWEDELFLRSSIRFEDRDFRVVGIYETDGGIGGGSFIMPEDSVREVTGNQETFGGILVEIENGFTPEEVKENLDENLRDARDVEEGEEGFQVQTFESISRSFNNQLSIINGVLAGIASISLLVGGVGIMNTMYTSVTQRTREIGVMKAVGASNHQIRMLFMVESGIIGLIGGVIGATLGLAISSGAAFLIRQQIDLEIYASASPELIIGSLMFSFVVGTVSGVLPAQKAAKLKPAEALNYD